jgi:hypothetical protein
MAQAELAGAFVKMHEVLVEEQAPILHGVLPHGAPPCKKQSLQHGLTMVPTSHCSMAGRGSTTPLPQLQLDATP